MVVEAARQCGAVVSGGDVTDAELMAEIRTKWGALIAQVCHTSSVPPAFLAALIAGESGGDPNAKRFEPGVLASLWEVLLGRKTSFGSIGRTQLLTYAQTGSPVIPCTLDYSLQRLDGLATSWGLTQIMGYNAVNHMFSPGVVAKAEVLADPGANMEQTITMLAAFAHEFDLDLATEAADLLRCWNTGRPNGQTADPRYVDNGLARMKLYSYLPPMAVSA
jgi:hypothetical protein